MSTNNKKRGGRNRSDVGSSRQNSQSQQDAASRGQGQNSQELSGAREHSGRGSGGHEFRQQSSFRSVGTQGQTEYKENTNSKRTTGAGGTGGDEDRFNAEEAHIWLQDRYKTVLEEYEQYKKTEEKNKSADKKNGKEAINRNAIQSFSDVSNVQTAWGGGARPILPRNEDFLQTVQQAIQTLLKDPPKNNY